MFFAEYLYSCSDAENIPNQLVIPVDQEIDEWLALYLGMIIG